MQSIQFTLMAVSLSLMVIANPIDPNLIDPVAHSKPTIVARTTTPGPSNNFSTWCNNIYAYPGAPASTIYASCFSTRGSLVNYHSYLDLNKCFTNVDGVLIAQAE